MPKIRTRKGLAKRIRITRNGKLMRAHAWKGHNFSKKSQKRKRAYRQSQPVAPADAKLVRRGLGV